MRHVFPVITILAVLLAGCDSQPPKPNAAASQPAATVTESIGASKSSNQKNETNALQQQAYTSLTKGELLSACQHKVQRHAFEEAVCRQQRQAGIEWMSYVPVALPKPSTVLDRREDRRNPWQWLVARETCWSADCLHAERVRTVVKRCGSNAANALQGSCAHDEIIW